MTRKPPDHPSSRLMVDIVAWAVYLASFASVTIKIKYIDGTSDKLDGWLNYLFKDWMKK